MKPFRAHGPEPKPLTRTDIRSVLFGVLSGLAAAGFYMLFSKGVVGSGILWAALGMALAASIFTLNGLGWGAEPGNRKLFRGCGKVVEILPPLDVVAMFAAGEDRQPSKSNQEFSGTSVRSSKAPGTIE
ncbi:MAG TPA: hypothetical protein VF481_05100 [Novosphingobium sp.]